MEVFGYICLITVSLFGTLGLTLGEAWCGCYYCMEVYKRKEVVDFTDNGTTAICPKCGIDSVLPHTTDKKELLELHNRYFT